MDEEREANTGREVPGAREYSSLGQHLETAAPAARAMSFWSAVCLPWVALVLLFTGVATSYPYLFTLLLVATFVAAVFGHGHTRT